MSITRTNLLTNPSFETGLTGYGNPGSLCTLAQSTAQYMTGSNSMKVTFNSIESPGVAGTNVQAELTAGVTYTFSIHAYVPAGFSDVQVSVTGSATGTGTTTTANDVWQRIYVTVTAGSTGTATFNVLNADITTSGQFFYVDGALLETWNYLRGYFDGTTINGNHVNAWTGTAHASTSTQEILRGVVGVSNSGNNITSANPTVSLATTPEAGDVMVLFAVQGDAFGGGNDPTAVSGLGATWTKKTFTKAASYGQVWVGTGATATGTVTVTAPAMAAGRAVQLYHLRGVTATVSAFAGYDERISKLGSTEQVVIALGNGSSASNQLTDASFQPAAGLWYKPQSIEMSTGTSHVLSAYLVPSENRGFYAESDREILMIAVGNEPSIARRTNLVPRPNFESNVTTGYSSSSITGLTVDATDGWDSTHCLKGTATGANAELHMAPASAGAVVAPTVDYTFAAWVKVPGTRSVAIGVGYDGANPTVFTDSTVYAGTWTRLFRTEMATGTSARIYIRFNDSVNGDVLKVDSFSAELATGAPYFDGGSYGYYTQSYWNGATNESTSTLLAYGTPVVEPRVNLFTNPSGEVDTTGWSAVSGTIARYTGAFWSSASSIRMSFTNPTAALAGFAGGTVTGLIVGETYTASLMAFKSGVTNAVIVVNDGTNKYGTETKSASGDWEMLRLTFVAAATTVTVGISNVTAVSSTLQQISIDALTLEAGSDGSPFAGDHVNQDGMTYTWTGAKHASTSVVKPGRLNQCINPSFGDGTRYGWNGTTAAGTYSIDTAEGTFGNTNCFKAVPTSTGLAALLKGTSGAGNTAEMCPVTPGKTYTFSYYVKSPQLSSFRADLQGANSSGVLTATYTSPSYNNNLVDGGGQWTRFKNTVTVAAGDYFLVPTVQGSITGGVTYYIDGLMIEEGGNAGPYFDGEDNFDWVNNSWTGTRYLSPSTQVLAPITSPTVIASYTGAVKLAADPTVDVPDTPSSSEVLILIAAWSTSAANPTPSAVSGLGATWQRIPGGADYLTAWIGTGASSSGTVTATATATTYGRSLKLYRVSGVSPDAIFQWSTPTDNKVRATPNQIAIGVGYSSTAGTNTYGTRFLPHLWQDDPNVVAFTGTDRTWNTAWMRPPGQEDLVYEGHTWGGIIVVGSPVANTRVYRRNVFYRAGQEMTGAITNSGVPNAVQTTTVHSGKAAFGGATSLAAATFTTNSSNLGAVKPDTEYTLSAWVWSNAARNASIVPQWKSSGQATITSPSHSYTAIAANTWTQITWTGVSLLTADNYGAFYAGFQVSVTGGAIGDLVYLDDVQIDEGPVALPFLDHAYVPAAGEFVVTSGDKMTVSAAEYYIPSAYQASLLGPTVMHLKLREAGAWVEYPGVAKARVFGAWVEADLKYWNGSAWIAMS